MNIKTIPYQLILFRLLVGPGLILLAYFTPEQSKLTLVILIALGLISDILDGIIARNQGISTPLLRKTDSMVDIVFWLCTAITCWILQPVLLRPYLYPILVLFCAEMLGELICIIRFKKTASTHAFLTKMWGVSMVVLFISIIGFEHVKWPMIITLVIGTLSTTDRLLILTIIPKWMHDIPSFYHAIKIRQGKSIKRHRLLNG